MSEYLSKEEIKQWRSSLEKITLEEFAARLGKKLETTKPSHDLADIVLKGKPVTDEDSPKIIMRTEKLSAIAERAMLREKEISTTPFTIKNIEKILESNDINEEATVSKNKKTVKTKKSEKATSKRETKSTKAAVKTAKKAETKNSTSQLKTKQTATKQKEVSSAKKSDTLREEVQIVFKKALTDREQKVYNYFFKNKNKVVFAKDLATLLDLPKDYVYKYIKNIRSKIEGAELQNAERGGFLFSIK